MTNETQSTKPTSTEVLLLAKNYSLQELKKQIDRMESAERKKLLQGIREQRQITRVSVDTSYQDRLNELEAHIEQVEKTFGQRAAEAFGSGVDKLGTGVNAAIDMGAEGVKSATNIVTDQAKKATDAVVQIGAQVSEVLEDPNRSKTEKAVHIAGLAAIVGVPAFFLYKLCKKAAGDEVKEGEKPSLGRKLLKWTGFAFLGGLGVRALAPMLSEAQRGVMVQQKEKNEAERKKNAFIGKEFDFSGKKMSIVEEKGQKLLKVGEHAYSVRITGNAVQTDERGFIRSVKSGNFIDGWKRRLIGNVNNHITDITSEKGGVAISYKALAGMAAGNVLLSEDNCKFLSSNLSGKKQILSFKVMRNGEPEMHELEFTPEQSST